MKLLSTGLSHLGLRVMDLARARQFYVEKLGFQAVHEGADYLICNAYGTIIALHGATPQTDPHDRFDPFRVGLDHLALEVADLTALEVTKRVLDKAGVRNNGIELDEFIGSHYISFYDPDGIAWELYTTIKRPRI
jgi:catechol 2,3-dioxygenase-like lactoylglutathione lyase family enzyme